MVASIPARAIVSVVPNVISAGGTGLDLSGLILSASNRVPVGSVQNFASADDVASFFGPGSSEAILATIYFAGFDNSNIKPANLLFAQYPQSAVPAYLRGASVASMTLAQLQALNGTLGLTVNGNTIAPANINLSAATSFSNAAALIQTALNNFDAAVTGSITGTQLTVSAVGSGALAVGQVLSGAGVTAGTVITGLGTGTGGTGTYTVSPSQTAASTAIKAGATTVAYDSTSGAFVITGGTPGAAGSIGYATGSLSAALGLTAATGAITSQGAAASTPGGAMDSVVAQTQNFATFMTAFKPSTDDMVAFAAWNNARQNRFLYAMWDNDITVTTVNDSTSAGARIIAAGYGGTAAIYDPTNGAQIAAFAIGAIAAIDFAQLNGRTNLAFRRQAGIPAGVTNESIAAQLIANGYNFVASYATANDSFTWFYPGQVTGDFLWIDSYINQIWMNNAFQLSLMTLLDQLKSIPYNADGYGLIEAAMSDPINAALNFGAIRAGVTLSALQAAEVNTAAGVKVSDVIQQRGWYTQVRDAAPQVRAARGSPPVTFWYTDGQSIQRISLASVEVQ